MNFNDTPRQPAARPDGTTRPEPVTVYAHWSGQHDGVNVEIDLPPGIPLTVHVNDGLLLDIEAED